MKAHRPARKHHFVPAGYLGRFAEPRGRQGQLFVFDVKTRRTWTAKPETQAFKLDLYSVEGDEPDRVEKALAAAESDLLAAVQRIERGVRSVPDVEKAATFVAMQSIRGPEVLDGAREFMEDVAQSMLRMVTHRREWFDAATSRMRSSFPNWSDEELPTYEEMHAAIRDGSIKMDASKGSAVAMSLSALDAATSVLVSRSNVIVFGGPSDELVTSSSPVLVSGPQPVGLGTADSILMSLGPKVLFMSLPGERRSDWMSAPPMLFAQFNVLLAGRSRMVFGKESVVMSAVEQLLAAEVATPVRQSEVQMPPAEPRRDGQHD